MDRTLAALMRAVILKEVEGGYPQLIKAEIQWQELLRRQINGY